VTDALSFVGELCAIAFVANIVVAAVTDNASALIAG
jgi:hypothetical protein